MPETSHLIWDAEALDTSLVSHLTNVYSASIRALHGIENMTFSIDNIDWIDPTPVFPAQAVEEDVMTVYTRESFTEALIEDYARRNGAIPTLWERAMRSCINTWLGYYTDRNFENFANTFGQYGRYMYVSLEGDGEWDYNYDVNVPSPHGIRVTKIYTTEETGVSVAEAVSALKAALPKWVEVFVVKGAIRFRTDRHFFESALDGLKKVRVNGHGKERYVGHIAIAQATEAARTFKRNYVNTIRQQMKDRAMVDNRVSKPVRSGQGDVVAFYKRIAAERSTDERIINKFTLAGHGLVSSRNWGIEVEVAGARGCERPAGWGKKGDGSLRSAYLPHDDENRHRDRIWVEDDENSGDGHWINNPNFTSYDSCVECMTYRANNGDSDGYGDTAEFVSPILHSYHSKGLEKLLVQVNEQPQNNSAGVHVHVDASDLTVKHIGSLVYGYSVIEPLLEASYQRTKRQYCRTRPAQDNVAIVKSVKELSKDIGTLFDKESLYTGDRYVTLNLQALSDHGTVEFRAMGPVYDYEYLIKWAHICRELVNVAKAGVKPSEWNKVKSFNDLQSLFIRKGAESVDILMSTIDQSHIDGIIEQNVSINYDFKNDVLAGSLVGVAGEI